MAKDRSDLFEKMALPSAVLKLVLPSIAASLVSILYNLADTYFVGMLNDSYQSAGVTFASTITLALVAVQNLFGVGGSSFFGRCLGAKEYDRAKKTAAFIIWASIAFGLFYSVVYTALRNPLLAAMGAAGENLDYTKEYLFYTVTLGAIPSILNVVMAYLIRGEGMSVHASIGTMSGCILNIILDPFFVLPQFLNMGAAGAGAATCISNCVACLYFIVLLTKKKESVSISFNPKFAVPDKTITWEIFSVGIPAAIQNLLNVTGMFVLNNFASAYGSDAVAAAGISHKLFLVPLYVTMAFSQGTMPLLAFNYGSRNYKRAKNCLKLTAGFALTVGIILTAIYFFNSEAIIRMFMKKPEVVVFGGGFLKIAGLAVPFMTFDFMGVALYQAFGRGRISLFFAIGRKVILEIPFLFLMDKLIPFYGLAYAQPMAEGVMALAALGAIVYIFRKLEKNPEDN